MLPKKKYSFLRCNIVKHYKLLWSFDIHRNIMKSGEMKLEMTLFHTMGPNRNVLFQTHLLFVTIYGLMWSSFNIR